MKKQLISLFKNVFEKNELTGNVPKMDEYALATWFEKKCKQLNPIISEDEVFEIALTTFSNVFYIDDFKNKRFSVLKEKFSLFLKQEIFVSSLNKKDEAKKMLSNIFPQWTNDEIENVVNSLTFFYYRLLNQDENALLDRITSFYSENHKKIQFDLISPKYFYVSIRNSWVLKEDRKEYQPITDKMKDEILTLFDIELKIEKEKKKKLVKQSLNIENAVDFEKLTTEVETISNEDAEEKTKAVIRVTQKLLKDGGLSKAEHKMLVTLVECMEYENMNNQTFNDYKNQVQIIANESPSNFRKILNRLRDRINLPENRELKTQLYGFKKNPEDLIVLEFLEAFLNENMKKEINLKAYRFSEEELQKILELKSLFQNNGFEIERLPEVYFDDYDRFKEVFGEIENDKWNNDFDFVLEPEMIGIYTNYSIKNQLETKEGIIVLFKDRIERYASYLSDNKKNGLTISENITTIRLLVLLHEVGHWICHWPLAQNKNWTKGFGLKNPKTHESLAQLITYWMIENQVDLKKHFEDNLVPTNKNNIYALYEQLISFDKEEIIKKIIFLREHYFLDDELNFLVLKSKFNIESREFWADDYVLKLNKNKNLDYILQILLSFNLQNEKESIIDSVLKQYKENTNIFIEIIKDRESTFEFGLYKRRGNITGSKFGINL